MSKTNLLTASDFIPNKTLGRSGHSGSAVDELPLKIRQMDALLCLMTSYDTEGIHFQSLNEEIQTGVLELAADVAHQVHEAYARLEHEREARRRLSEPSSATESGVARH